MDETFTPRAKEIWFSIPEDDRQLLSNNVWCSSCRMMTTIVNFKGAVKSNDLILNGVCKKCGNEVARLIENEPKNPAEIPQYDDFNIDLTKNERDLLSKLVMIEEDLEAKLKLGVVRNDVFTVKLNSEDLELLLGHIAAEANHTPNKKYQNELDDLFDKLNVFE